MPGIRRSVFFTATHRSGSTLLMATLRQLDRLGRPAESFYPHNIADTLRRHCRPASLAPADWLPWVVRDGSSPNGWFAAKLFADNFRWLAQQLGGEPWPDSLDRVRGFFSANFPDPLFVAIRRSDRLRQAVSLHRAMQSGVWHSDQKRKVAALRPFYQRDLIRWAMENITAEEGDLEQVYARLGVRPLVLEYDELAQDLPGALARVFAAAGESMPAVSIPPPGLAKLANPESEEWIARYRQEEEDARLRPQPVLPVGPESVFQLDLDPLPERVLPGIQLEAEFTITNLLQQEIRFIGGLDDAGTIRLLAETVCLHSGDVVAEQLLPNPQLLAAGGRERLHFHFPTPVQAGPCRVRLKAVQAGGGELPVQGEVRQPTEVSAELEACVRSVFGDFEFTPHNWYYSPWFGHFNATSTPHILSLHHGWLRLDPQGATRSGAPAFADSVLGGWSTTADTYPRIRRTDGTLLWYLDTDGETRTFRDAEGRVLQVPISQARS